MDLLELSNIKTGYYTRFFWVYHGLIATNSKFQMIKKHQRQSQVSHNVDDNLVDNKLNNHLLKTSDLINVHEKKVHSAC